MSSERTTASAWVILILLGLVAGLMVGVVRFESEPAHRITDDAATIADTGSPADDPYGAVDNLRDALDQGRLVYNPPASIPVEEQTEMELRISVDTAAQALRDLLSGSSTVVDTVVEISPMMSAELRSLGTQLEVAPLTASEQPLGRDNQAHWRWKLTAVEPGLALLVLTVRAAVPGVGGAPVEFSTSYEDEIRVTVTPLKWFTRWLRANWRWVLGAILIPVILYLLTRRSGKSDTLDYNSDSASIDPSTESEDTEERIPEVRHSETGQAATPDNSEDYTGRAP